MSEVHMHIGRPAAWIEVTGEDSLTFLQGQSTNDLKSPAPTPATYTLWLDRKGKILADSFVLQETPERFFLFSYSSPAATILERLEAYIIADDVALRDLTEHAASATLWGDGLADVLLRCGLEKPDQGSFLGSDHRVILNGRRSRRPNIDVIVTGGDNEKTLAELSAAVLDAGGKLVDAAILQRERIESCIPSVPHDAGPKDLPQEGNLEAAAISYTKGCYLGQEVMARIHSMGQVRRTLARVRLQSAAAELPSPLYAGTREAGSLRTLTDSPPFIGLALIRKDVMEKSRQLALVPDGPAAVDIDHATEI